MAENDILVKVKYSQEGEEKIAQSTNKIEQGFSKLQAGIVTFQAALMIADRALQAVGGALDATVGKYERYSRQVMLLSQNLGLSSEETSRLIQVSDDYGISIDAVTSALQMMVRRGTAPSIEALAQIADQYVAIEDPIKRAALMTELLGRNWTTLTPLLQGGGDAIRANSAAIADDLIITQADIKATEELRIAKDELNDKVEGLSLRIGKVFAPAVNTAVYNMGKWLELIEPTTSAEGSLRKALIYSATVFGEHATATEVARQALIDFLATQKEFNAAVAGGTGYGIGAGYSGGKPTPPPALTPSTGPLNPNWKVPGQQPLDPAVRARDMQSAAEYNMRMLKEKEKQSAELDKKLAAQSYSNFERDYKRKESLAKLEDDIAGKRIAAAQSLSKDLASMDSGYYADRLKAAESYGLESQRAEEDHQRDMRKLAQSHDQRMSKLADSRDALGLQDEMSSYEQERRAAEEDFSLTQSRRDQDYANQMRDMEQAHQMQRQKRIDDYNQQLADIAAYNIAQKALIQQQFTDIANAILTAFTLAARQQAANVTNSTTTNSANVTQTFNGVDGGLSGALIQQATYAAIAQVFAGVNK